MKNTLKIMVSAALAAAALAATAMPTKRQLAEAQKLVNDLTADDIRSFNAKQKTASEVAAKHLDLAAKADTEAGKYLLLDGAFRLYAHGGDYDAAADVLQRMKKDISDIPPELIVELVDGEMRRVAYSKAPKVHAIYSDARRTIKYRKRLTAAEAEAEKRGTSKSFKQLAECHVHLGNWKKALETFAQARITAAKWELDPKSVSDCDALKAAEYWWNYEAEEAGPFRAHAAALYRIALDEGLVTGLRREVIKKRTKDMGFAIVNRWEIPKVFSSPLERTLKLADGVEMTFCACPPGSFTLLRKLGWVPHGIRHKVNITRPFWMAKTVLTLKQYATFHADENVEAAARRLESKFPNDQVVVLPKRTEALEFISWLNKKRDIMLPPGYVFRLPTEAEARYMRGGNCAFRDFKKENLDPKDFHGLCCFDPVSSKQSKYGMLGIPWYHIRAFTADSANSKKDLTDTAEETDPIRIGNHPLCMTEMNITRLHSPDDRGFVHIVIAPDLLAEKKAAEKK